MRDPRTAQRSVPTRSERTEKVGTSRCDVRRRPSGPSLPDSERTEKVGTSRCDVRRRPSGPSLPTIRPDGPAVRPYQQSDRTARRSVPTNNQTGWPGGPSLPTIRPDGPAVRPYLSNCGLLPSAKYKNGQSSARFTNFFRTGFCKM